MFITHMWKDGRLQGYASGGFEEEYVEEVEEKALTKVWILMGGDGLQRQNSIKSGLHAWLMLQNNPELQVHPAMLCPAVPCCAALCCAMSRCAVLCCAMLGHAVLCRTPLCCSVLCCGCLVMVCILHKV